MHRAFVIAGAVAGFLGVALGAFGAHALKERISTDMLAVFQTGVHYQTLHAVVLLFIGLAYASLPSRKLVVAGWLFVAGTAVFSGSLYALALTGTKWFGAITPIGGVCFLSGWLMLVVAGLRIRSEDPRPNT